jgi:hypothetical protein
MKKIILAVVTLTLFASGSMAQDASIRVKGTATDVSGTELNEVVNVSTREHVIDFTVDNLSGSTQNWSLSRKTLTPSIGWIDEVCWGAISTGEGNCSTPTGDSFTTGYTVPVQTTTTDAEINIYITAPTGGSSSYRYYIMNGTTKVDSVDVTITKTLGLSENISLALTVAPNPASNVVNINMEGVSSANLKIVDVLGNVVLKEIVYESSKKVDVTKFKNGIYFITVEAEGIKPITRKLIIRH